MTEGWGWPLLIRKAHYFRDGTSLCRKWMYMGKLENDVKKSPDDCKQCQRKREAELAK